MKNIKEFFGVFLSVIICVLVVSAIAYATTTISTNIVTGGTVAIGGAAAATELSVIGTASISEDLWASGSFQFGGGEGTATVAYSRLGTSTTGHSLADADDLLISGLLEMDDVAWFDNDVVIRASGNSTELSVLGTVSISEDLWASGSFQFGGGEGTATVSYNRLGTGSTGHSLADADDLLVTGLLEVDSTASFDLVVSVSSSGLLLDDDATITSGVASISGSCTIGSIYLRTGVASMGAAFNVCTATNVWTPLAESDL